MWKPTRQNEKNNPVHDQHRPEHRDIKEGDPRAHEGNQDRPRGRVPELELGETADEGTELVVLLGGETRVITIFQAFVLRKGRVELGLQEKEEEVQEVDSESVGNCKSSMLVLGLFLACLLSSFQLNKAG